MPSRPLLHLDPKYVRVIDDPNRTIGFRFECPACPRNNAGGVHSIVVYWDAPKHDHGAAVWDVTQRGSFQSITVSPSIEAIGSSCRFHGWVESGLVRW